MSHALLTTPRALEGRRERTVKASCTAALRPSYRLTWPLSTMSWPGSRQRLPVPAMRQSARRLTDLVAVWKDATAAERAKIASSILATVVVKDRRIESFRPRPSWAPYFEELAQNVRSKRETSLELAEDASWGGKRVLPPAA